MAPLIMWLIRCTALADSARFGSRWRICEHILEILFLHLAHRCRSEESHALPLARQGSDQNRHMEHRGVTTIGEIHCSLCRMLAVVEPNGLSVAPADPHLTSQPAKLLVRLVLTGRPRRSSPTRKARCPSTSLSQTCCHFDTSRFHLLGRCWRPDGRIRTW